MANKYQRFGLRADRNLSDLPNSTTSLDNILEDLVVSQTDKFGAADLLVISGLKDTRVTAGTLAQVNDILPSYTPTDGGPNQLVEPYITIKDQIENFKVIAGDPPYLSGGLGPIAYKYDSTALDIPGAYTTYSSGHVSSSDVVNVDDFIGSNSNETNTLGPLDFWQSGVFKQSSKFAPGFPDVYGAVVWEGWTNISSAQITANGCFLLEYRLRDTDPWVELGGMNYYDVWHSVSTMSSIGTDGGGNTTITMNDPVTRIHEGCRIQFMKSDGNPIEAEPGIVSTVEGSVITLDKPMDTSSASFNNIRVYFDPTAENMVSPGYSIPQRYAGLYTNVRMTWWYPPVPDQMDYASSTLDNKVFELRFGPQDTVEYYYFYPTDPALSGGRKFSYEQFLLDRISDNVKVSNFDINNTESFLFAYNPPLSLSDVFPVSGSNINNSSNMIDNTEIPNSTIVLNEGISTWASQGISQGDYIIWNPAYTALPVFAQIYRYDSGSTLYLNPGKNYGTLSPNEPIGYLKHDGLIGLYRATINTGASTITFSQNNAGDMFDLTHICKHAIIATLRATEPNVSSQNNLIILTEITAYTNSGSTVTSVTAKYEMLTPGQAAPSYTDVVAGVYASKGLHDNSSPQQCLGVIGAEVATAQSGNSITLTQTAGELGLSTGDYIQFGSDPSSATYSSDYIPNDTTITVSAGSTTINVSSTGSQSIPASATVVFIKAGDYVSGVPKEFCIVPLNTAPPFESNDAGLITPSGFGLKADSIEFRNIQLDTTATINTSTAVDADKFIPLYHGSTRYKLLIKSTG